MRRVPTSKLIRYYLTEADDNRDADLPLPAHVVEYACVREPPVLLTWLCEGCRQWTTDGSYLAGRCKACGTERPAE